MGQIKCDSEEENGIFEKQGKARGGRALERGWALCWPRGGGGGWLGHTGAAGCGTRNLLPVPINVACLGGDFDGPRTLLAVGSSPRD